MRIDLYDLAREIINHNISEQCDSDEITQWINDKDSFIWDKLVRHGHSEIFNDEDECDDYCTKNSNKLFKVLKEIWDVEYDQTAAV